jgi:ParB family chromosome partitioning protein
MRAIQDEVNELRVKLKQFDSGVPALLLDPTTISVTRFANRHAASFSTPAFAALKASIELAGGNTQPILVRTSEAGQYEVVFGHRRHRACTELGLPVLAVVWTRPMADLDLFLSMDRENRERADLSPFEQGSSYLTAISSGLFPSSRRLAEAVGVSHTWIGKAVSVAQLPAVVLEAFRTPIEIQPKHAKQIAAAMETDRDGVLRRAERLRQGAVRQSPAQTVDFLTGRASSGATKTAIRVGGTSIGTYSLNSRGRAEIIIKSGFGDMKTLDEILGALKAILIAGADAHA